MRVVLDTNVLVSALLVETGVPAEVLRRGPDGEFDIVVSPQLLAELERVLTYPKLRARITPDQAARTMTALRGSCLLVEDPTGPPPVHSEDSEDDYLLALASSIGAALVSGDQHLLAMADVAPVMTPAAFLARSGL